jgi:hypothetical protein
MKNYTDSIGNRTRHPPACSAAPQPTAPLWSDIFLPRSTGQRRCQQRYVVTSDHPACCRMVTSDCRAVGRRTGLSCGKSTGWKLGAAIRRQRVIVCTLRVGEKHDRRTAAMCVCVSVRAHDAAPLAVSQVLVECQVCGLDPRSIARYFCRWPRKPFWDLRIGLAPFPRILIKWIVFCRPF